MTKILIIIFLFPIFVFANFQNGIYKFNNLSSINKKNAYKIVYNDIQIDLSDEIEVIINSKSKYYVNYYLGDEKFKADVFENINIKFEGIIYNIKSKNENFKIPKFLLNESNLLKLQNYDIEVFNNYISIKDKKDIKNNKLLQKGIVDFVSYFGNNGLCQIRAITEDKAGYMYFGGELENNVINFSNIIKNDYAGYSQIVIKTNKKMEIIWISMIGGGSKESVFDLTTDDEGFIWGVGETHSSNYPLTPNALQTNNRGDGDGVIFRLSPDGGLFYGSYYGTSSYEALLGIEYFNGKIYTVGQTGETSGYFVIFDKNGKKLTYGSFNGNGTDSSEDLAIDSAGNMYLTGWVNSDLKYSFQSNNFNGGFDSYVVRFNINTLKYDKLIYIGGNKNEQSYNIEIDRFQNIYVTGSTTSNNFPIKNSNSKLNGTQDYFITKINPNFEIEWSHYLGGSSFEGRSGRDSFQGGLSIQNDVVFLGTITQSNDIQLIDPLYNRINEGSDVLLESYDLEGNILFSSIFGGNKNDYSFAVYVDSEDYVYSVGTTLSNDLPVTDNAFVDKYSNSYEGFIMRFKFQTQKNKPCDNNYIEYSTFKDVKGLNLVQHAVAYDSTIRLTKPDFYQKGAIWVESPLEVSKGFNCEFTFEFSEGDDKEQEDGFLEGADGIAFVIQGISNNIIGVAGGGIGFENLKNAFAIELDMYHNDEPGYNDPNGNHIAAFSSKSFITPDHSSNDLIKQNIDIEEIVNDKRRYKFKTKYDEVARKLYVYVNVNEVDKADNLVLQLDDFDLAEHLDLISNTAAFVGVTSATGNAIERHEIFSFKFCGGKEFTSVERELSDNLIYPNPANSYIYINNELINSNIRIYDMIGNLMAFEKTQNRINISSFKTGLYLIEFETEKGNQFQKFIVE